MSVTTRPDRDPRLLALVFAGGTAGTAARAIIAVELPPPSGAWPWPTFIVNITGAFLLGLLLGTLVGRGPDVGRRRVLRLTAGTGFLGGYTTYSAFAVEILHLSPALGLLYALATVLLGVGAAAGGHVLTHRAAQTGDGRR